MCESLAVSCVYVRSFTVVQSNNVREMNMKSVVRPIASKNHIFWHGGPQAERKPAKAALLS